MGKNIFRQTKFPTGIHINRKTSALAHGNPVVGFKVMWLMCANLYEVIPVRNMI